MITGEYNYNKIIIQNNEIMGRRLSNTINKYIDARILNIDLLINDIKYNYLVHDTSSERIMLIDNLCKNILNVDLNVHTFSTDDHDKCFNLHKEIHRHGAFRTIIDKNIAIYKCSIIDDIEKYTLNIKCFRWFEKYNDSYCLVNIDLYYSYDTYVMNGYKHEQYTINKCNSDCIIADIKLNNDSLNPMFSFGSPFIECGYNKYLGIGHIKINTPYHFYHDSNLYSNLQKYKGKSKELQIKLFIYYSNAFKNTYKPHYGATSYTNSKFFDPSECCSDFDMMGFINNNTKLLGYHYLDYFMVYNEELNEMYISDPFLCLDIADEYKFTLSFSSGITLLPDDKLLVTSGEGDFYCKSRVFDKDSVVSSCVHNIKTINYDNLHYYLYIKDTDGVITKHNLLTMTQDDFYKYTNTTPSDDPISVDEYLSTVPII